MPDSLPSSLIQDMLFMEPEAWVQRKDVVSYSWWKTPSGHEICFDPLDLKTSMPPEFQLHWRPPGARLSLFDAPRFARIPKVGPDFLSSVQISCAQALQERAQRAMDRLKKTLILAGQTEGLWIFEHHVLTDLKSSLHRVPVEPALIIEMQVLIKTCAFYIHDPENIRHTFICLEDLLIDIPKTLHERLEILQS